MFLKHSLFKKLLKASVSGSGILMAADPEGYYLQGGWWRMYIQKDSIDKETKSVVIGVSGELPDKMPFRVYKTHNQYEIEEIAQVQEYLDRVSESRNIITDTKLEIREFDRGYHLYQIDGSKILMMEDWIVRMIDWKTANKTQDDFPKKPTIMTGDKEICWSTDQMIFSCCIVEQNEEERKKLLDWIGRYEF